MIKLLKQYVEEMKRANDLKERELNQKYGPEVISSVDPFNMNGRSLYTPKQEITVHIPQLNNLELKSPDTGNSNWTVFSSGVRG
tara:strand:- start:260 stop:511 length:252 start_codon:yes stop_codon:yes gene_type:complete